jgi:hypothetical protein
MFNKRVSLSQVVSLTQMILVVVSTSAAPGSRYRPIDWYVPGTVCTYAHAYYYVTSVRTPFATTCQACFYVLKPSKCAASRANACRPASY